MDQHYGSAMQGGSIPPIRNPPPQIFGGYSTGDSPLGGNFASSFLPDEYGGYDYAAGGDDPDDGQGDPKRRRIARACDMCRKKKIKCDGKMPKCSHCENYKTECIFTQVEKKRQPPKGAKYIESLENRLGRMEGLLRMSGLLAEDDAGKTDLGTLEKRLADKVTAQGSSRDSISESTPPPRQTEEPESRQPQPPATQISSPQSMDESSPPSKEQQGAKPKMSEGEVEALADQMCSLVTNNLGETRYIGSSSGFSIFSPKGIQWVSEKTGDASFQDMISKAAANDQWFHWKPEIFGDIFQRRTFQPLPPKHEALALLKDYFQNLNSMFPLFHEPTFMLLVHKHYSLEPYEGSGWWASLNVALALAHRMRVMSNVVDQEEDELAWLYLKNAMDVQTELTMRNNDLLSIQALLGMALFLQGTPNPHPPFYLVSAAIRLAHSIGLHKRGADFHLNEVESEQRKRVFWIAYTMDKDICLRSGRPPVQDDDDMNVELPSEDPPDNIGNVVSADGKKFNLFRTMCEFGQIQSRVYKQLYSVKASRQSDGELLNTIGQLDQELEEWKDRIPIHYRPEQEINAQHTPLILHIVVLHFAYYNCLTTIHRMSVHHGYWTSRLSDYAIAGLNARPLNPRVFMSAALCVNAARTSVSLLKYIPHGDFACVWLVLYYPISALVTLFANILQNPHDARARSDLRLMRSVVEFLTTLSSEDRESNGHFRRMLNLCTEFERICRIALEKAEREIKGRGKRRQAEQEKAEATEKSIEQQQIEQQSSYRAPVNTPRARSMASPAGSGGSPLPSVNGSLRPESNHNPLTPQIHNHASPQSSSATYNSGPTPNHYNPQQSTGLSPGQWLPDMSSTTGSNQTYTPDFTTQFNGPENYGTLLPGGVPGVSGPSPQPANAFAGFDVNDLGMAGAFQQPFVPQDLWQMPMTLEWDWADLGAMGGMGPAPGMGMGPGPAGGMGMPGGQQQQFQFGEDGRGHGLHGQHGQQGQGQPRRRTHHQ